MFSKSTLKDHIGILYYRHGLFCASNPYSCLLTVIAVVIICCLPLTNLTSFSSSLEKYYQSVEKFDGLEANAEISQFLKYEKLPDRPAWYNHIPVGYVQRIIINNVLTIPDTQITDHSIYFNKSSIDKSNHLEKHQLYLIDTFRTGISQLFEINEFLRNYRTVNSQTNEEKSLVNDLCLHVGEMKTPQDKENNGKRSFPEFNCLYLSPTNFWSNDFESFIQDDNIIQTMNNLNDSNLNDIEKQNESFLISLYNRLKCLLGRIDLSSKTIVERIRSTSLGELLFGIPWNSITNLLRDNTKLIDNLKETGQLDSSKLNKSVVFSYAITIVLKKYDREFIEELREALESKFSGLNSTSKSDRSDMVVNLQYLNQSFMYYIPYLVLYTLLFLYIYISVRKIEFVKSKWGLAFAAVAQVLASLLMAIGICTYFGLTPTLNGGEIFPYLIIFIGFENIVVLTKSIVSTPFDLDVRYRIALGLKKESWQITKILSFELIIIWLGIFTMVPAIQEFCVFAYVGLLIDFFMQMIFFVTVLSIDIRRMDLNDLNNQMSSREKMNIDGYDLVEERKKKTNDYIAKFGDLITPNEIENKLIYRGSVNKETSAYQATYKSLLSSFSLTKKSVQFFYFWAKTRLVQRALIILSILWIILIFYKSLLVVELMRHDVNVSKETVDALLPKNFLLQKNLDPSVKPELPYDNTKQYFQQEAIPQTSTVNYLKLNFFDYLTIEKAENSIEFKRMHKQTSHNWETLSYYHWLTLFDNYNVSLYNRYVAILPEINLNRLIKHADILTYRNKNEIKAYNSVFVSDGSDVYVSDHRKKHEKANEINLNKKLEKSDGDIADNEDTSLFKSALFELIVIVILGIPTIFIVLYTLTLFYKCLCSKRYEEWRRSWSTSNIKRQYKKIHSRSINDLKSLTTRRRTKRNTDTVNKSYDEMYSSDSASFEAELSSDSDYESCTIVKNGIVNKDAENSTLKRLDNDVLLNRIINGQKDDVDLIPIKIFNQVNDNRHKYPLDLLTHGSLKCATSDINNQIKIWPLDPSRTTISPNMLNINQLNQSSESVAVWSMSLSIDDQVLFVGQSDGQLRVFNLDSNLQSFVFNNKEQAHIVLNNGVTHLKNLKHSLSFDSKNRINDYYVLIARLNGFIELINYNESNSISNCQLKMSSRIHNCPIMTLTHSRNFLLTTSQDFTLKFFELSHQDNELEIHSLATKQIRSQITSMCVYDKNSVAAVGTTDGFIYIWDLNDIQCEICLTRYKSKSSADPRPKEAITKLLIINNIVISLHEDRQMCIWNRSHQQLIKEFTFFSPESSNNSYFKFILSIDIVKLFKSFFRLFNDARKGTEELTQLKAHPTMCLYSKKLLITGGCSCIYIWDITKDGELVKKINIIKPTNTSKFSHNKQQNMLDKYSQRCYIKHIELIKQHDFEDTFKSTNKLLLIRDYSDSIFLLKIPPNIIQKLE